MGAKQRKGILAIGAVLLMAVAAYWYWSPLLALRQMQTAAKTHDGVAFNERVDYPRLRESVKAHLAERQGEQDASADAAARMRGAFAKLLVNGLIDGLVQPDVVMGVMRHGTLDAQRGGEDNSTGSDSSEEKKDWIAEREGMSTFIAFIGNKEDAREKRIGLVMERSGFANWRLVGLRMPAR